MVGSKLFSTFFLIILNAWKQHIIRKKFVAKQEDQEEKIYEINFENVDLTSMSSLIIWKLQSLHFRYILTAFYWMPHFKLKNAFDFKRAEKKSKYKKRIISNI